MPQAKGRFEDNRSPQDSLDAGDGQQIGHFCFDETFSGSLDAVSVAHMLAFDASVEGSAAYVATERTRGMLDRREGSFFDQHNRLMTRATPSLLLIVVPDSKTDGLLRLGNQTQIENFDVWHLYKFGYELKDKDTAR